VSDDEDECEEEDDDYEDRAEEVHDNLKMGLERRITELQHEES